MLSLSQVIENMAWTNRCRQLPGTMFIFDRFPFSFGRFNFKDLCCFPYNISLFSGWGNYLILQSHISCRGQMRRQGKPRLHGNVWSFWLSFEQGVQVIIFRNWRSWTPDHRHRHHVKLFCIKKSESSSRVRPCDPFPVWNLKTMFHWLHIQLFNIALPWQKHNFKAFSAWMSTQWMVSLLHLKILEPKDRSSRTDLMEFLLGRANLGDKIG